VEVLRNVTTVLRDFLLEQRQHCSEDVVTHGERGIQRRNHCNRHAASGCISETTKVVAWHSGNVVRRMKEVTLCQVAR